MALSWEPVSHGLHAVEGNVRAGREQGTAGSACHGIEGSGRILRGMGDQDLHDLVLYYAAQG